MKTSKLLLLLALLVCGESLKAQQADVKATIGNVARKSHQDVKKIAIGYFGVFQTVQNSQSQTSGGGSAHAKMTVNFGGVDQKAYQDVVLEAYNQAVAKLKSLGYEVLSPDQIKATGVETILPTNNSKEEKAQFGTVKGIRIQAPITQVDQDMTPLGYLPFVKRAKQMDAIMINFDFGATAVAYDRGSRYSRTARVSASPWLTFGGNVISYPPTRTATPAVVNIGFKDGYEDFIGPKGIFETDKNYSSWLGSSFGKYVIDIDQAKYLSYIKGYLAEAVNKSIDAWHAGLSK